MNIIQYSDISVNSQVQESPKRKYRRSFKFNNQQKGVIFNNFDEKSYHEQNNQNIKLEQQFKNINKSVHQQINISNSIIKNNLPYNKYKYYSFKEQNQKYSANQQENHGNSINLKDSDLKQSELHWKYSPSFPYIDFHSYKKDVQYLKYAKKNIVLPDIQQREKNLSQTNKYSQKKLISNYQNLLQSETLNDSIHKSLLLEKHNQDSNQQFKCTSSRICKQPVFNFSKNLTERNLLKTENSIIPPYLKTDISQYIQNENNINNSENQKKLDQIKEKYLKLIEENRLKFQISDQISNVQVDLDYNQICKDILSLLENDIHTRNIIINYGKLSVEQFIFYINKLFQFSTNNENSSAEIPLKIDLNIREKLETVLINRIVQDVKGISNNQINNIKARFRQLTQNFLQRKLIDDIGGIEKVEIIVQNFVQKCQNEWLQVNETHISKISNVICDILYDKIEECIPFLKTLLLTNVEFYVIKLIGYEVCSEQQMPNKMKFEFLEYINLVQRMLVQIYFNKKLINVKLSKNKQLQIYLNKKIPGVKEIFLDEIINSMFGKNKLSSLGTFLKENFQNYNLNFLDSIQEFLIQNIFDKGLSDNQLMKHYIKIQIYKLKIILGLINDFSFIFIKWDILFKQFHDMLLDQNDFNIIKTVQLFDFTFFKEILQMSLSINNNLTVFDIEQGINYHRIPKDVLKIQIDVFVQMIQKDQNIQVEDKQNFTDFIKSQSACAYFDAV